MSRLLFAAARGARVQRQQQAVHSDRTWWEDVDIQWGLDDELRIHPDDEHLQYGPISSALRELAVTAHYGGWPDGFVGIYGSFMCNATDALAFTYCEDILHRSLFLLILAEALADEGL